MIVRINGQQMVTGGITDKMDRLSDALEGLVTIIERAVYWINPVHWIDAIVGHMHTVISHGMLDVWVIVITQALILLWSLGAKWPKKIIFWGWIVFWTLRGVVFA